MKTAIRKTAKTTVRNSTKKTARKATMTRRVRRAPKPTRVQQGSSLVTYRSTKARAGTIVFVVKTGSSMSVVSRGNCDFLCTVAAGRGQQSRVADYIDDNRLIPDGDSMARFPWLGNS